MATEIIEHDGLTSLNTLIDKISNGEDRWGAVIVRRDYLRGITNEAFLLSIQATLQDTTEAHVFYISNKNITVMWCGKQRRIYMNLRNLISTSLIRPGLNVDASVLVSYADPNMQATALKSAAHIAKSAPPDKAEVVKFPLEYDDDDEIDNAPSSQHISTFHVTREQAEIFHETSAQKPYRSPLHMLVVEDQIFSQKLLCEILRGVRVNNNNESPVIDAVQGIQEAWKIFLKKAPDITFIDLNLIDGSGHTLARAIKELDPTSRVIIVTSNSYEEELSVAKQNNVDSFVAKPYNKKQILDCVDSYINAFKNQGKRGLHGTIGKPR